MLIFFIFSLYPLTCISRWHVEDTLVFAEEKSCNGSALSGIYQKQPYHSATKMLTDSEDQPMVQMMPVLRAVVGSESMSSRHMCSRKVSAMAALSCCVWMKAEPMSWVFVWGMVFDGATVEILQEKKKDGIIGMTEDTVIANDSFLWLVILSRILWLPWSFQKFLLLVILFTSGTPQVKAWWYLAGCIHPYLGRLRVVELGIYFPLRSDWQSIKRPYIHWVFLTTYCNQSCCAADLVVVKPKERRMAERVNQLIMLTAVVQVDKQTKNCYSFAAQPSPSNLSEPWLRTIKTKIELWNITTDILFK